MVILVTGGAGFIGSHVVDALVEAGHRVRVVDSLDPAAHDGTPSYLNPGAEYLFGDVCDDTLVAKAVRGVDAVSHQAAKVGLGVDFGDALGYVLANDAGTAVLLTALHRERFTGPIVLASSMVVYGEGRYACAEHGEVPAPPRARGDLERGLFDPRCPSCGSALKSQPIGEDRAADPRNVYAATKLHQEHLCAAFAREHDVPLAILRYHNVYGPRMPRDTPYAGVASIFRSALAAGRAPRVFEDGNQIRDFVHVRDVAAANVAALTKCGRGVYNVASGSPRTVGDMARSLHAAFDGAAPPPVVTGEFRLGDVRHVFASPARAQAELGFEATVAFDDGMRELATATLRSPSRR